MLNAEELEAIRALERAATPGPWVKDDSHVHTSINTSTKHIALANLSLGMNTCDANAAFIAASRTDIPALLATLDELARRAREINSRDTSFSDIDDLLRDLAALAHKEPRP